MDVHIPGLRDRRVAASDQYLDGNESRERGLFNTHRGPWDPRDAHTGRWIYGGGSRPRLASQRRPLGFEVTRIGFDRIPEHISTIILHSTAGSEFSAGDLPAPEQDSSRGSDHRVDEIIAHFVVFQDGTIAYTHDVQYVLNDAGGRKGIDIEFAGDFPHTETIAPGATRLTREAIGAGRRLVRYLASVIRSLLHIHPHGQVQRGRRGGRGNGGKFDSCPGPDVWVNVGAWAVEHVHLIADEVDPYYPNHGISALQSNPAYRQDVRFVDFTDLWGSRIVGRRTAAR
jgi:hypothetical protein